MQISIVAGHHGNVTCLAVLDDDEGDREEMDLLVTGSGDKTVRLWNITNIEARNNQRLICTFTGHTKKVGVKFFLQVLLVLSITIIVMVKTTIYILCDCC